MGPLFKNLKTWVEKQSTLVPKKVPIHLPTGQVTEGIRWVNPNEEEGKMAQNITPQKVFELTQKEGGSTINPKTGQALQKGKDRVFLVSPYKNRELPIPIGKFSPEDVKTYIEKNQDLLSKPNHFLGTWHSKEDGNVYLDVSTSAKTLPEAFDIGRKAKQISVYDLFSGDEKKVPTEKSKTRVKLDHYSYTPIKDFIDPTQQTNFTGAEGKRVGRIPRSYYYPHGDEPERKIGARTHKYEIEADLALYDLVKDPEGFKENNKFDITDIENAIASAGYDGLSAVQEGSGKPVIEVFRPLAVPQNLEKADLFGP